MRIGVDKQGKFCYNTIITNNTKENKMKNIQDNISEIIICGTCILTIVSGSILGALLLLQTI